jgi:hypothetical protein
MKEITPRERSIAQLIRVIVWGQVLGHLWQVTALVIQDAPDYLARTSVGSILLPILILMGLHLFKLDLLFARIDPGWLFIALGLILSLSMTAMTFRNVRYFLDIPDSMITPSWRYNQITSIISLFVFGIGLVFTGLFSSRVLRSK